MPETYIPALLFRYVELITPPTKTGAVLISCTKLPLVICIAAAGAVVPCLAAGQVLFLSNVDGDQEFYLADLDSTNVTKLTDNRADEMHGAWSPAGDRIAAAVGKGEPRQQLLCLWPGGAPASPAGRCRARPRRARPPREAGRAGPKILLRWVQSRSPLEKRS